MVKCALVAPGEPLSHPTPFIQRDALVAPPLRLELETT